MFLIQGVDFPGDYYICCGSVLSLVKIYFPFWGLVMLMMTLKHRKITFKPGINWTTSYSVTGLAWQDSICCVCMYTMPYKIRPNWMLSVFVWIRSFGSGGRGDVLGSKPNWPNQIRYGLCNQLGHFQGHVVSTSPPSSFTCGSVKSSSPTT